MINKNSNSEEGIVKKDENINKLNAQLAKKRAHEEINKTISEDGNANDDSYEKRLKQESGFKNFEGMRQA